MPFLFYVSKYLRMTLLPLATILDYLILVLRNSYFQYSFNYTGNSWWYCVFITNFKKWLEINDHDELSPFKISSLPAKKVLIIIMIK